MLIRNAGPEDLARLMELSPPEVKRPVEFAIYPTLVAELDGVIAGYTQFCLTPDGILHSLAIRIGAAYKGQGVGSELMEAKLRLARAAGAHTHIYAVAKDGEVALKKILDRLGMHACLTRGDLVIYMQDLQA
jgi:ribosomal protein S18 acetylase RimI-like enzyme